MEQVVDAKLESSEARIIHCEGRGALGGGRDFMGSVIIPYSPRKKLSLMAKEKADEL
ncbi:uncharacterized protein G2W53_000628 [Senna tora]|uniref:Uncharacterized protein n=1 Tax=Senna tora TaxID=362788 RepID=A0A834XFQ4_9FABA|nr:uncharacterized protein G2W53_000628 [Senna tora]